MEAYSEEIKSVLDDLNTSDKEGLSSSEAKTRLEKNGKNVLEKAKGKSLIVKLIEQFKDPMIIILICAAIVSGILSFVQHEGFADVIIILFVVVANAILGVYQESKAESAIEELQKMSSAKSKVLRDGEVKEIASEDIVVGDIVLLEAGDLVPVDGRLIDAASLKIEEAALTGESVAVNKIIEVMTQKECPLADRKNMAYMGTTVVYGRGTMCVTGTGMDTEMGKIADALTQAKNNKTPLQIKMAQLSKVLTVVVLVICAAVFAVQLIRSASSDINIIMNSFMIAVSLAVAAIPEGLAAVVTVVLSLGVTNMSKKNAIIRKLTAVETLGCAQIICSDKTGTLTQNKMTVVDHDGDNKKILAKALSLCNDTEISPEGEVVGEPTEAALVAWADKVGENKNDTSKLYRRVSELPFDSKRKMMSTLHTDPENGHVQFTKGAPDVVISKCSKILKDGAIRDITDDDIKEIKETNKKMADKALRVLSAALAYREEINEDDLVFLGLVGMIDPIRPEVKDAITRCKSAGIRPIMITGDNIDTASAIARELGILHSGDKAITGLQLNNMDDDEFFKVFEDISVYARVQPEHKTRIVKAWQKAGNVVGMTGDGVNDAPSIKNADIGIGMGITGTDVTKNVADMVLADDNFATIVNAVEEGRRIYDNIRKAIQFLLSSNIAEVLAIFIATIIGFIILQPVQLLWVNLVTDCFPALALGVESAEANIMKRKPRKKTDGVFAGGMGFDIVYQGIFVMALTLTSYFLGHYYEFGNFNIGNSAVGTTMAFLTLSFAEIFHSINMRSQRQSIFKLGKMNKMLLLAAAGSLIVTMAVCIIPGVIDAFGLVSLGLPHFAVAIGLGFVMIPVVEIVKLIQRVNN